MKVLFVAEHGSAPSTRLRLADCLEHYRRAGVEATVLAPRSNFSDRLRVIREARLHNVVVLFKSIGFSRLQLALLQRANPRIIFDFDDAVMFREQKYERPLRARTFDKFLRTVEHCVAVVAGNRFLGCFAEACGCRTIILPTPIDLTKYQLKEQKQECGSCIGWLGLSDGFRYLQRIAPAFRKLEELFPDVRLKVVSDKPLQLDGVRVENELWRIETEQANLASFDVGIMPLWDSAWTRGKCSYKILQYMGVGTPVVASPVGMNPEVITHGVNGYLAETEDDWVSCIGGLLENAKERKALAARGRELVEKEYSLKRFTESYVKLFREVCASSASTRAV